MGKTITFDTHAYVKKLMQVGFTPDQAEALASAQTEIIEDRLATKDDVALIQKDIELIRRDIKELELRMTIKLGTLIAASIAIVAALVKLL